jgi:cbb3-type cytochrome oxidase subunit 3
MKKWYLILLLTAILYLVFSTSRKHKKGGREILRRLNSTMSLLAWFLLLVYGLAFIYWVFKSIF